MTSLRSRAVSDEVRTCRRCGWSGPITRKDGYWYCRACARARQREKYRADPSTVVARNTAARTGKVARNHAFIDEVNARTTCAHCGAQPVEWHNFEHVQGGRLRFQIGRLVGGGAAIATIVAELARCTPLCRACHMAEDGRLIALMKPGPPKRVIAASPAPCAACGRPYAPLRKQRCSRCYHRDFRVPRKHLRKAM